MAEGLVQRLNFVIPPAFQLIFEGDGVGILFNGQAEAEQGVGLHYAAGSEKEDLANIAYQIMSTTQDVIAERTTDIWPASGVTQVRELPLPELSWSGHVLRLTFVLGPRAVLELPPLHFTEPFQP